jgi:hypothetical protein
VNNDIECQAGFAAGGNMGLAAVYRRAGRGHRVPGLRLAVRPLTSCLCLTFPGRGLRGSFRLPVKPPLPQAVRDNEPGRGRVMHRFRLWYLPRPDQVLLRQPHCPGPDFVPPIRRLTTVSTEPGLQAGSHDLP